MNRPLEKPHSIAGLVQGWAGHPFHSRPIQLTSQGTPDLDVGRAVSGHAPGKSESLCLLIALSFLKKRRPWFIGWSNNALATGPFLSGMVGRFLKPQFRAQHERLGFSTARNHVRRPLCLALVDQPMAQLHGCETRF
jgi:hypothetical protein